MILARCGRFDAFLSYHSVDAAWVARLKTALEHAGVRVWLDKDQILPGDRFADALERGIQSSRSVVFVVSNGSMRSLWVRLIPALIQSVAVTGFLGSREFVYFVYERAS